MLKLTLIRLGAILVGCGAIACSKAASEEPAGIPAETTQGTPSDTTLAGTLVQASTFAGTTNVGVQPRVNFVAKDIRDSDIERVAAGLTTRARFVDRNGNAVSVNVKPQQLREKYVLIVTPTEELRVDEWYTLTVDAGKPEVEAGPMTERIEYSPGKALRVPMFTGSAPAIDRLVANKDGTVDIYFSEPIRLGSISTGVTVAGQEGAWAGCASFQGRCLTPDSRAINESITYKFDSAHDMTSASTLTVTIPKDAIGGGRSVEEASRAGILGGGQSMRLAATDWKGAQAFRKLDATSLRAWTLPAKQVAARPQE